MGKAMLLALVVAAALGPRIANSVEPIEQRIVEMRILTPDRPRDARPLRIATLEKQKALITIEGFGRFGFLPTVRPSDDTVVIVTLSNESAEPARELGQAELRVGSEPIDTKTEPSFRLQVVRVAGGR